MLQRASAVVWRDGKRTRSVPQEHLDAVVCYELHERGICAAQRKVARAWHVVRLRYEHGHSTSHSSAGASRSDQTTSRRRSEEAEVLFKNETKTLWQIFVDGERHASSQHAQHQPAPGMCERIAFDTRLPHLQDKPRYQTSDNHYRYQYRCFQGERRSLCIC